MAGFVVVPNSKNPLDNTIIHPESYHIAETILNELRSDYIQQLFVKNT